MTDPVVQDAKVVADAVSQIIKHPNTWVANLTTLATGIVACIALFHPGFTEPASVEAAISSVGVLVAAGSQIVHFSSRRSAQTAIAIASLGTK